MAYGAHLTVYCRRLQAIATAVQGGPLDWVLLNMLPDGSLKLPTQDRPTNCRPRRIAIPFDPPTREQSAMNLLQTAGRTSALRVQTEQRELRRVLKHLGVDRSPLVAEIARTQEATRLAMQADSHGLGRTKHLHASPSLREASHDPAAYRF